MDNEFMHEHFNSPLEYRSRVMEYVKTRGLPDEMSRYLQEFEHQNGTDFRSFKNFGSLSKIRKNRRWMMKSRIPLSVALLLSLFLAACTSVPRTPTGLATITATFDMGAGGAGFASLIYAQEVHTGKTFHTTMSAGAHGLVVLPTSPPVTFTVEAPGTYVFYAVLINEDSYHFGATGCKAVTDCTSNELVALDVVPGGSYSVYIGDRSALLPPTGVPVTVPWHK